MALTRMQPALPPLLWFSLRIARVVQRMSGQEWMFWWSMGHHTHGTSMASASCPTTLQACASPPIRAAVECGNRHCSLPYRSMADPSSPQHLLTGLSTTTERASSVQGNLSIFSRGCDSNNRILKGVNLVQAQRRHLGIPISHQVWLTRGPTQRKSIFLGLVYCLGQLWLEESMLLSAMALLSTPPARL